MRATINALRETRSILVTHGWIQGSYGSKEGVGFCLDGALRHATIWAPGRSLLVAERLQNTYTECRDFVRRAINGMDIAYWNDRGSRTKDQVLEAVDQAIIYAQREYQRRVEEGWIKG